MASILDIGIPDVISGIMQPKLKNRFRVTFSGLGDASTGAPSIPVSAQVVSVSRPSLSFEEVTMHRYNSVAYTAGKHSFEDLSITIEDDIMGSASQVIQNQLQTQQQLIGVQGPWLASRSQGSLFKFSTVLEQLDGNATVLERWVYQGCWLKSVNYNDLDYSASDQVQINLTIRFDHARQTLFGTSEGSGFATGGQLVQS